MKLPRDLTGRELITILARYGYEPTRQSGSHAHLQTTIRGQPHRVVVPVHSKPLPVGTLDSVLRRVAAYLEMDKAALAEELFGRD